MSKNNNVRSIEPEPPTIPAVTLNKDSVTFQALDEDGMIKAVDVKLLDLIKNGDTTQLQLFQLNGFLFTLIQMVGQSTQGTLAAVGQIAKDLSTLVDAQNKALAEMKSASTSAVPDSAAISAAEAMIDRILTKAQKESGK